MKNGLLINVLFSVWINIAHCITVYLFIYYLAYFSYFCNSLRCFDDHIMNIKIAYTASIALG